MDVFLVEPEHVGEGKLRLFGEEFHHLMRVMRKKQGDHILVSNGRGIMYRCVVGDSARESVECIITERMSDYNEPLRSVTLVQSLLKHSGRMDWIVEKTTELGVRRIIPVVTTRSIPRTGKADRWRKIARAASKQCMRSRIPDVDEVLPLNRVGWSDARIFVCHESDGDARFFRDVDQSAHESCAVCIGPEGGFSDEDMEFLKSRGGAVVSLGKRRLRSETAAVAALTHLVF